MVFSAKPHVALMEKELLIFWELNQEGWAKFTADPLDAQIDDIREEIEVMAEVTDWPMMRENCLRCIQRDEALRQPLLPQSRRASVA